MELLQLTDRQVGEIYRKRIRKDFPPDEIKPLAMIRKALAEGRYACYGAFDGGQVLAYVFLVINGRHALVDYFAVREDLRGQGTGSGLLRLLAEGPARAYDCVLLESEDPAYAADEADRNVRERRIRFYLRNGLADTGITVYVWYVYYRILALPGGEIPSPDRAREIYGDIYRSQLPAWIYEKVVRLRPENGGEKG